MIPVHLVFQTYSGILLQLSSAKAPATPRRAGARAGACCRGHWEKPESELLTCQASPFLSECPLRGGQMGPTEGFGVGQAQTRVSGYAVDKVLNLSGPHW